MLVGLTASSAGAQEPSFVLSPYLAPAPASLLQAGFAADSKGLGALAAVTPLRLSLLSSIYPLGPAFGGAGCSGESVDVAQTALPFQPHIAFQLTPRLVLHGFSDLGCLGDPRAGIDAGAGGGLTYAAPVRADLWLVAGTGFFGVPSHGVPGQNYIPPRAATELRLDLVKKKADGGTLSVGLGARGTIAPSRSGRIIPAVGGSF
jgi:hypothetical protein